jgi:hypothetical protein
MVAKKRLKMENIIMGKAFRLHQIPFIVASSEDAAEACCYAHIDAYYILTHERDNGRWHIDHYLKHCSRSSKQQKVDMAMDIMMMRSKCWRNRVLAGELAEYEDIILQESLIAALTAQDVHALLMKGL